MNRDSSGDEEATLRIGQAIRAAIDLVRRTTAPGNALREAAEHLERAGAILEPFAFQGPFAQGWLRPSDGSGGLDPSDAPAKIFPYSPVIGPKNPIAPPVEFEVKNGDVHGRVSYGAAYTGPPGFVHGGVIAATFDELLGMVNVIQGNGAMTGTLTVRYNAPTPIGTEVRMVGRTERREGRKVYARGEFRCGETLTAEAEGIFIVVDRDQLQPS